MAGKQIDFLLGGVTDTNGDPVSAGKVYTYAAGTSTPLTVYQDAAQTTPWANPVVLDSEGRALVYTDGSIKLVIKTSADVTLRTHDNLKYEGDQFGSYLSLAGGTMTGNIDFDSNYALNIGSGTFTGNVEMAAGSRVGVGTGIGTTPDHALVVASANATANQVAMQDTTAVSTGNGPIFNFYAYNSTPAMVEYASFRINRTATAAGAHSAKFVFVTKTAAVDNSDIQFFDGRIGIGVQPSDPYMLDIQSDINDGSILLRKSSGNKSALIGHEGATDEGVLKLYSADALTTLIGAGTTDSYISGNLGVNISSPNSTLMINGSVALDIQAKTADYPVTADDCVIHADCTGGDVTITLPASASGILGRIYTIKRIDASGNSVIIDGNASETIDGATTVTLAAQWQYKTVINDGSNWLIIASH